MAVLGTLTKVACPACGEVLPPIPLKVTAALESPNAFNVNVEIEPNITQEWLDQVFREHPGCAG